MLLVHDEGGHQMQTQSDALKPHNWTALKPHGSIRRNQTQSDAISRNQTHSSPIIGRPSAVSGGS